MLTPLAHYAVQVVVKDRLDEAEQARRRRHAREARHAEEQRLAARQRGTLAVGPAALSAR
jgi:hypothetical protein